MVSPDQIGKIRGSMQRRPQLPLPKTYDAPEFTHMSNTDKSRHTGALATPTPCSLRQRSRANLACRTRLQAMSFTSARTGTRRWGKGEVTPIPPSPTHPREKRGHPQGLGQKPVHTHTQGTRRLPHLPTRVFRESGPGPLRHGPRPAPAHCAASPRASREASRGQGPFRPGCPATGTQGTHYSVPLHQSEYPRSSPVTRRLAKTARAYMAPLHSAGCNADRQLIGRL